MWNQTKSGSSLYWGWLIAWIAILLIAGAVCIYRRYKRIKRMKQYIRKSTSEEKENYINRIVAPAGFLYDRRKDIFYAREDGWQKQYGYTRLYDEAAPALGMVIDCEPIYFNYGGQKWLLEMWKGQYGMTLGGEVGLYLSVNDYEKFYRGVDLADYIGMKIEVYLKKRQIFCRMGKHWWMTGFRLGEWAYPWNLRMTVTLTFFDRLMCQRFVEGLRLTGYQSEEYQMRGDTVRISFDTPHTKQPLSRNAGLDRLRVRGSALFCNIYHFLTREYDNTCDKLIALQTKAPRLFARAMRIGKTLKLFQKGARHV